MLQSLYWYEDKLYILDQKRLPYAKDYIVCSTYLEAAKSIIEMNVRGAPAIGIAAAYGFVLGSLEHELNDKTDFIRHMHCVADSLRKTRPTAVNLFWALDRMLFVFDEVIVDSNIKTIRNRLLHEAHLIHEEDLKINITLGEWGQQLVKDGDTILTHCNAGALATAGYGTALGVIRAAHNSGKKVSVFADETRPYLQGARLTAWELMESGIDVTLIADCMAGYFLKSGKIDAVIVGADRVAANGDVANKIGTYALAVLAKENNVPFYVASPLSTFDFTLSSGEQIEIEMRSEDEITQINGLRIAPIGVKVINPAFDITPNRFISAIITEYGVFRQPYIGSLTSLQERKNVTNKTGNQT